MKFCTLVVSDYMKGAECPVLRSSFQERSWNALKVGNFWEAAEGYVMKRREKETLCALGPFFLYTANFTP